MLFWITTNVNVPHLVHVFTSGMYGLDEETTGSRVSVDSTENNTVTSLYILTHWSLGNLNEILGDFHVIIFVINGSGISYETARHVSKEP